MYRLGEGVPQDYQEARKWYTKAAEQGEAYAQYALGRLYAEGDGVPKDLVQSHKWFNIAAAQGDSGAEEHRDALTLQMTPELIAEAQRLSSEFWEKLRKAK